jgi:hypothetical protein
MPWLKQLLSPLAGYPIYALIATFTSFDYWPSSPVQWAVLGGLAVMAFIGHMLDEGSAAAARRGEASAIAYRQVRGFDDDPRAYDPSSSNYYP